MKRIQYRKSEPGIELLAEMDDDINREPETNIERYNAFFHGVPLHGGEDWVKLGVDEIVKIFKAAATEIHALCQNRHDNEVRRHNMKSGLVRRWREFRGWSAPEVPSREDIIRTMAKRCLDLSSWMKLNSTRPFYCNSDMTAFIDKPYDVAVILKKTMYQ